MFKSDAHNTLHPRCNAAAPENCIKKKGAKLGPKNRYNFDTHPLLHVVAPCLLEVSYPCFFFVHACCVSSNPYIHTYIYIYIHTLSMHALCGFSRNHASHTTLLDAHIVFLREPMIAFVETMSCAPACPLPRCTHWPSKGLGKHLGGGCCPHAADTHEGCW